MKLTGINTDMKTSVVVIRADVMLPIAFTVAT